MSEIEQLPPEVERFIEEKARGDRSIALALHALVCTARDSGDAEHGLAGALGRAHRFLMLAGRASRRSPGR